MPTPKLTADIIAAAIGGYEFQKTRIDTRIAELRNLLAGRSTETAATPQPPKRKRRKISAAGRKAIAEAQRKRWAASKKAAEPSVAATPQAPEPKRRISKAGMARIIAATKERWARVRAAKAQLEKAARKAARKKAAVKKAAPVNVAQTAKKSTPARKAAVEMAPAQEVEQAG